MAHMPYNEFNISIHAPCTGSDRILSNMRQVEAISIHAPCTGSDDVLGKPDKQTRHFNPRSLHGERRLRPSTYTVSIGISIHAPCTGSDLRIFDDFRRRPISIHAPCTGSDTR